MEVVENRDQWQTSYDGGWLAHYQETGELDWSLYPRPRNRTAPAGLGIRPHGRTPPSSLRLLECWECPLSRHIVGSQNASQLMRE
jgi:hypothetical protein